MPDVVNYIKITAGWQFKCFYESIQRSHMLQEILCQIPRAGPFVKEGQEGFSLQRPYNQLENSPFFPLPWREREGVRGDADLHPHLNPPPSEGRRIVGYLMVRGCPSDMG